MNFPSESNKPLDLCRANLGFALRLAALLQESRQRSRQLETQAADSAIAMLRAAAQAMEGAQDWGTLANAPGNLMRDQAQMMAKFWEGWFGIALQNGSSLQAGVDDAVKHWQSDAALDVTAHPLAAPATAAIFDPAKNPFIAAFMNAANALGAANAANTTQAAPSIGSVSSAWSNAPGMEAFSAQIDHFIRAMSSAWAPSAEAVEPASAETVAAGQPSATKPNGSRRGERHAE
jgi:hypothetical protein